MLQILDKHHQLLAIRLAKDKIRKSEKLKFYFFLNKSKILTACPAFGDLAPLTGGYLIPHEYPADGQHLSNPVGQKFCEETTGVIPDDIGTIVEAVADEGAPLCK